MPNKPKHPATEPALSILDQRFKYTPSAQTDLGKKFKAVKREQKRLADEAKKADTQKVRQLRRTG